MKLRPNQVGYDFAIDDRGEIDYVHLYDRQNEKKDVISFLQGLLDDHELVIGEGCDGEIIITDDTITISYGWMDLFRTKFIKESLEFPNV